MRRQKIACGAEKVSRWRANKVGMKIPDLYNMPLDREELSEEEQVHYDKAFQLLCEGQTFGVFQFAGSNITRVLQQAKPILIQMFQV